MLSFFSAIHGEIFGVPITLPQAGSVQVFRQSLIDGKRELITSFYGDRSYGRFGEIVQFHDLDGDGHDELIISAPRRSNDITEEFEAGILLLFLLNRFLSVYTT